MVFSLCKKTPNTALFSFLKQSFTISKLLGFKNIESLVFEAFLSKTKKNSCFLAATIYEPQQYLLRNICRKHDCEP